ncbi:MAG: hypothetical protein HY784_10430 [Chloroflexi bacterium]|nr:hypothetical protein [Chloroflexota bacterium]
MTEITVQVPDRLANRLQPMAPWLPAVLELSMIGFRTPAAQTAAEVIQFLVSGPAETDVAKYHVSDRAQGRVRRLLALNAAGALSSEEQTELDEIEQIEHVLVLLKARANKRLTGAS